MARTERSAAVVLRAVAYGESDRIVTLLTEAYGKVAVMARGARKSKRRFAGALEPYALVEAEVALGKGGVGRLAQARVVRAFPGILAQLGRMTVAAAGLELLRETLGERDTPDERLLPTTIRFFELAEQRSTEALRIAFTMRVLALQGLSPHLSRCGRCGKPAPSGAAALFDPRLGAIVCRACGGAPSKLRGGLREALIRAGTRAWDEVALEDWSDADARAARAIDEFVAHQLGRRLASGDMLTQVREVEGDPA